MVVFVNLGLDRSEMDVRSLISIFDLANPLHLFRLGTGARRHRLIPPCGYIKLYGFNQDRKIKLGQNENDAFVFLTSAFSVCVFVCVQSKQPVATDLPVTVSLDTKLNGNAKNYNRQANNCKNKRNGHWQMTTDDVFSF